MMIAKRALPAVSREFLTPAPGREFRARHDFYFQHRNTGLSKLELIEFSGLHRRILRQMIANRGRIEILQELLPARHGSHPPTMHFSRQFEGSLCFQEIRPRRLAET